MIEQKIPYLTESLNQQIILVDILLIFRIFLQYRALLGLKTETRKLLQHPHVFTVEP